MAESSETVKQVFFNALEIHSVEARASFLDKACAGNPALRCDVEALLAAHERPESLLDGCAFAPAISSSQTIAEMPGDTIGPYKLLDQIGEGGMGVVFMAEQVRPVQRTVAVKIIKPGMDTRQVISRFEAERQALAMMDHSNIARVLDAGTTETGRPYFVMELVEGKPITKYCDEKQLSPGERLNLFLSVCHAVQHAHQKGIIHRDIKPTNVLVGEYDKTATPKVIDFGVAKATARKLAEQTISTSFGQIIGTFAYMSPEQARFNELDVDTRSDIYSLGVLMYELLTGSTPFETHRLETAAFDETLRIIREEEPPRPSARLDSSEMLASIAAARKLEPARLSRLMRGELDWIVMKALEKDRNRRYATANALAADVKHYLNDEPVTAVAPSRLYRASKFVRRNKGPVLAYAAVLLGLVAGIVGTTIGLVSQFRQRAIAERERAEAQLNFATALQSQRKYAEAEDLFRQELQIPSGASLEDKQRVALTRLRLAEVVSDRTSLAEAEPLHREALAAYREAFPPGDPNIAHALTNLALVLRSQHQFEETKRLFREVYEIHRGATPADHRAIGESAANLTNVLVTLGNYAEAEPLAREAVAELQLAVPEDTWLLAFARLELGRTMLAVGKFHEAEKYLLESERGFSETQQFHLPYFALMALYVAWDRAEPGKGYDTKAGECVRNLIGTFVRLDEASIPTLVIRAYDEVSDRPSPAGATISSSD